MAAPEMRAGSPSRRGFTLIEIVVLAAIVLIMAAITLPALGSFLDMENAKQARNQLVALQLAITNPTAVGQNNLAGGGKKGFSDLVNGSTVMFPSRISQLVIPISASTDYNCKDAASALTKYTKTNVTNWGNNGPFFNQGIIQSGTPALSGGLPTAVGTIRDTVARSGLVANTVELWLDSLELQDAQNIDLLVDNVVNATAGSVQYSILAGTYYRLRYMIPITNNWCAGHAD